jgi:hypothetical protein
MKDRFRTARAPVGPAKPGAKPAPGAKQAQAPSAAAKG